MLLQINNWVLSGYKNMIIAIIGNKIWLKLSCGEIILGHFLMIKKVPCTELHSKDNAFIDTFSATLDHYLTHGGRDKMAAISQATLSNAFS